jgi:uncharacterized protein
MANSLPTSTRVVLDTNVFISGFFGDGTPRKVLAAILDRKITLLTSEAILTELEIKLSGKKLIPRVNTLNRTPEAIIDDFRIYAEIVSGALTSDYPIRDAKDQIILICAVNGKADYIVSGDKDLTTLRMVADIPILTPAELLALIDASSENR